MKLDFALSRGDTVLVVTDSSRGVDEDFPVSKMVPKIASSPTRLAAIPASRTVLFCLCISILGEAVVDWVVLPILRLHATLCAARDTRA